MRTRLITASLIAVALATVTAQNSQSLPDRQDAASQPIFRASSNFIRVDMYATRGGAFVTDLRPEELGDTLLQQRVVRTAEHERIDGTLFQTSEITGNRSTRHFVIHPPFFYQWNKHRTGSGIYLNLGV